MVIIAVYTGHGPATEKDTGGKGILAADLQSIHARAVCHELESQPGTFHWSLSCRSMLAHV